MCSVFHLELVWLGPPREDGLYQNQTNLPNTGSVFNPEGSITNQIEKLVNMWIAWTFLEQVLEVFCFSVPVLVQSSSRTVSDPCGVNPCQNGGACALIPHTAAFECSCPERFTGTLCEHSTLKSSPLVFRRLQSSLLPFPNGGRFISSRRRAADSSC